MKEETSRKKGATQQTKTRVCKQPKLVVNQQHEEIISETELHTRNGIVKGKKDYLNLYLQFFFEEEVICDHPRTIQRLAKFIYSEKKLYVHKENGYKLMEFSSILTDLNMLSKPVQEKLEEQKEKAKKKRKKRNSYF